MKKMTIERQKEAMEVFLESNYKPVFAMKLDGTILKVNVVLSRTSELSSLAKKGFLYIISSTFGEELRAHETGLVLNVFE